MKIKDQIEQQDAFIKKLQADGINTIALIHFVWAIDELKKIVALLEAVVEKDAKPLPEIK